MGSEMNLTLQDVAWHDAVGRVQTPTLRLVVDRDRSISDFVPVAYWAIDVQLKHDGHHKTVNMAHQRPFIEDRCHRRVPWPHKQDRTSPNAFLSASLTPHCSSSSSSAPAALLLGLVD